MTAGRRYKILLCGRKELLLHRVKKMIDGSDIHFQYTSAPRFLVGRAMFNTPHIAIVDGELSPGELAAGMRELSERMADVNIYVVATTGRPQEIVEFMQAGAKGYYQFPTDYRKFRETMKHLLQAWRRTRQTKELADFRSGSYNFGQLVGESPRLLEVLKRARTLITNNAQTVLITGETGTGKSLLAKALHYNNPERRQKNYIDICCSNVPEALLESELFGYEKGAFTDARETKVGLFEIAGEGTIFLDEIGEMSGVMQSKLLGVLEGRTIRRLGGVKDIPIRACIILATSANLEERVAQGTFRKDLFYRLKILPLDLPPLRERPEDIPAIVEALLETFNKDYKKEIRGIAPKVLDLMRAQPWEGNIRELRHCMERAVLLSEGRWLTEREFEFDRVDGDGKGAAKDGKGGGGILHLDLSLRTLSLDSVEKEIAQRVVERVSGNKSRAAELLKISRARLNRLLR